MITIAHVITRMIVGGAQENTLFSAQGLAALPDYHVVLVTGPETGSEGNLLEGRTGALDVVEVPHLIRSIHPVADARALVELYGIFKHMRPDVVHTHSTKAGVLGRLAAKAAGVPVVVHTLHSLVYHDYQPPAVNFSYRMVKKTLTPLTHHYVSVSDNIRERAVKARIGPASRHSTIRSGFLTDDFRAQLVDQGQARERFDLPKDRIVIGVVARLFPLKGHAQVLAAARHLVKRSPEALFAFVGSGPLLDELKRTIRETGLEDNVRFLGRVTPEEIPLAFSAFDILAHASLREGLARVIPQAVLAGLPVVCYDLDGSSEVVTDGVNGFLVAAGDDARFADRLHQLVSDEPLRRKLGGNGRDRIQKEFSADEMVRGLEVLYQQLLAEKGSGKHPVSARQPGR